MLPQENVIPVEGLGNEVTLTASVDEGEARLTVSDGQKSFTVTHPVKSLYAPGSVGLFSSLLNNRTASGTSKRVYHLDRFRNFRALDSNGEEIFQDTFKEPDTALENWRAPYQDLQYGYYQRRHMRLKNAPMVRRTRFAPARTYEP